MHESACKPQISNGSITLATHWRNRKNRIYFLQQKYVRLRVIQDLTQMYRDTMTKDLLNICTLGKMDIPEKVLDSANTKNFVAAKIFVKLYCV